MHNSNCDQAIEDLKSRNEDVLDYIKKYDLFLTKIAYKVIKSCPKLEPEDIKQQLVLHMLIAYKDFVPERQTSSNTYLTRVVINASHNIVRSYWQVKNRVYHESLSLDSFVCEDDDNHTSPTRFIQLVSLIDDQFQPGQYFDNKETIKIIQKIISGLRPKDRKIFKMYIEGYSVESISAEIHCAKKTVYNVIAAVRKKIKKYDK